MRTPRAGPVSSAARPIAELYREHFREPRRERLFISSLSFAGAFAVTRAITHAIRRGVGPFHNVTVKQFHLHHLVFGILALLGVGYVWLNDIGTDPQARTGSRATAALYGAGSALTLDEFALWLNLEDVYWARQGRESIDAVIVFGALLTAGFWAHPFLRALAREAFRHRPLS